MQPLRFGVVGVGAGVFSLHRACLRREEIHLVGVSDVNVASGQQRADELGCPFFAEYRALLEEAQPEAVVVLTPHPFHAPIAIDALEAGAHVLVEKPIAVQVADADAMLAGAARTGRCLGVSFQQRFRPTVRAARRLIDSGRLGQIQRVELVAVWLRTASYYRLGAWRGTWSGEGGGVLMNQAPHNLDLLCFLAGQPSRVVAWNRTTLHAIETEDTALALVEWPDSALGTVYLTTAQLGQPERLDIIGTRGALRLDPAGLVFEEAPVDLRTFVAESPEPFGKLPLNPVPVELEPGSGDHAAVYANFIDAIRGRAPLLIDGAQALRSLELANAMILSSSTGQPVSLPLDRQAYAELLTDLRARSLART